MGINIITWFNEEKRCFDQWTWEFDEWTLDWYSLSIMWSPNLLVSWWSVLDPSHAKHWEFVFLRTDKNQHFDQNMAIWFFFWCKKNPRQGKITLVHERLKSMVDLSWFATDVPPGQFRWYHMAPCATRSEFFSGHPGGFDMSDVSFYWGIRMKQQNVSICWEDPVKQLIG